MDVVVLGPNLRDQSKGTFHVHAADCYDLGKYGPGRQYGGDVYPYAEPHIKDASVLEVVTQTYADQIDEEPRDSQAEYIRMLVNDFHFFPCVGSLPYDPAVAEEQSLSRYELISHEVGDNISTDELSRIARSGYLYFRAVDIGGDMYDYLCSKTHDINEMSQTEADLLAGKVYCRLTS